MRYVKLNNQEVIDMENDAIRAQVDRELPKPIGGFDNDEQYDDWREVQEARFMELVHNWRRD